MAQIIPPPPYGQDFDDAAWRQFFDLIRKQINQPAFYSQTTDPGTAGVPSGTWSVWKNTTSGLTKLWLNDGGVMKSVLIS